MRGPCTLIKSRVLEHHLSPEEREKKKEFVYWSPTLPKRKRE
jgi:hypothetical protein